MKQALNKRFFVEDVPERKDLSFQDGMDFKTIGGN